MIGDAEQPARNVVRLAAEAPPRSEGLRERLRGQVERRLWDERPAGEVHEDQACVHAVHEAERRGLLTEVFSASALAASSCHERRSL